MELIQCTIKFDLVGKLLCFFSQYNDIILTAKEQQLKIMKNGNEKYNNIVIITITITTVQ